MADFGLSNFGVQIGTMPTTGVPPAFVGGTTASTAGPGTNAAIPIPGLSTDPSLGGFGGAGAGISISAPPPNHTPLIVIGGICAVLLLMALA